MENRKYFTTGELAKLTGLSKQLLIFYDKKNFFHASSTGSNGYRYYLLSQYFQLKILITLRKLDIPLEEIYQYLVHGNQEMLLQIYKKKLQEYTKQIEQLRKKTEILENRIQAMEHDPKLILNQVFITAIEKERTYYQWKIDMSTPVKERIIQLATALRPYLQDENCFNDNIIGYILSTNTLRSHSAAQKYSFLTAELPAKTNIPPHKTYSMKPGIYLKVHGYGHYGIIDPETKKLILDFIERNDLKTASHYIVFPFHQCWMTTQKQWIMTTMIHIES